MNLIASLLLTVPWTLVQEGAGIQQQDTLTALEGQWAGELRYRDFQSNRQIALPATMDARRTTDGSLLVAQLAFQDPGRTVYEMQVLCLDSSGKQVIQRSIARDGVQESKALISKSRYQGPKDWEIVTQAEGIDNGRQADFRYSYSCEGDRFVTEKKVRYKDEEDTEWKFRNGLYLVRANSKPSLESYVGTWKVDLRPTPEAEPYYQELVLKMGEDGKLKGSFYGSSVRELRINQEWGIPILGFVTEDSSGLYATSAKLINNRLEGVTHSLGRGFISPWKAERKP